MVFINRLFLQLFSKLPLMQILFHILVKCFILLFRLHLIIILVIFCFLGLVFFQWVGIVGKFFPPSVILLFTK